MNNLKPTKNTKKDTKKSEKRKTASEIVAGVQKHMKPSKQTYTLVINRCSGNRCSTPISEAQAQQLRVEPNKVLLSMGYNPGTIRSLVVARDEVRLNAVMHEPKPVKTRTFQ